MNKLINMFLLASLAICFAACSDDDEPKSEPEFRFDNLGNIMGDRIWSTIELSVVDSQGNEYNPIDDLHLVGSGYDINFSISGNELNDYVDSDAFPGWIKYIYNYTFDRETGTIYLKGDKESFGQIVNLSEDEMEIHSEVGKWKIPGIDGRDEGSYLRCILQPETDPNMLGIYHNIEEVIDRRSE